MSPSDESPQTTVEVIGDRARVAEARQQWELYQWLGETAGVRRFRLQELREEIATGMEQVKRGETAPLDVRAIKEEIRRRGKP